MQYYPAVTTGIRAVISERFSGAVPTLKDVDTIHGDFEMAEYLLWMLEELQKFQGPELMGRRGRWIGYIHQGCERLGIITNAENRRLTKQDVADKKE